MTSSYDETVAKLAAERKKLLDEASAILTTATRDLSPSETTRFDEIQSEVELISQRVGDLGARREAADRVAQIPSLNGNFTTPRDDTADRGAYGLGALRSQARETIERSHFASDEQKQVIVNLLEDERSEPENQSLLARWAHATGSDDYSRAFAKFIRDPETGYQDFSASERQAWTRSKEVARAMSDGVSTAGGYMVPTYLDATIYLTNSGSASPMPDLANVVTIATNTWHGISSAGVSASWDAENATVSDDSPAIGSVTIPTYKGAAFVAASIEVTEDSTIGEQLPGIFADARDRLEAAAFATGAGTTEPTGIWTALQADTNQQLVSTTAATIGVVDLQATYKKPGVRWRSRGSWLMNPTWHHAIMNLGTALSASYSANLTSLPDRLLTKPVFVDDYAPALVTTTALDARAIFGDFSAYTIVRRVGQRVEYIPHLFDQATGRPSGTRGFYSYWRSGGAPMSNSAFGELVDKTSA